MPESLLVLTRNASFPLPSNRLPTFQQFRRPPVDRDIMQDGERFFEDAGGEDDLDYNAVGQLHFGGGFTRKENGHSQDSPERVKTKKEVKGRPT